MNIIKKFKLRIPTMSYKEFKEKARKGEIEQINRGVEFNKKHPSFFAYLFKRFYKDY